MSRVRRQPVLLLTILGIFCVSACASEQAAQPHRSKKAAPVEEPAPTPPGPVLFPPATLEQMPSRPAVVTLQNGELTIVAQNSSLAEILRVVSSRTGAS